MTRLVEIPAGMQTKFFRETEAAELPEIRREGADILIPVLVRHVQREDGDSYRYFDVPVKYKGQDISDYDACLLACYADIRRFFYGDALMQSELRDDHQWEAHRQAIRTVFPKHEGDINPAIVRWEEVKAMFWATIDGVLASVGKTRSDLPAYFNDSYMIEWAIQNEVPEDVIKSAEEALIRVSLNVNANDRNWVELFA